MNMHQWIREQEAKRLAEVIGFFGGVAALARFLGVPFTTVDSWPKRGRVSTNGAKLIAKLTHEKFPVSYLRPTFHEWFLEEQKAAKNGKN